MVFADLRFYHKSTCDCESFGVVVELGQAKNYTIAKGHGLCPERRPGALGTFWGRQIKLKLQG